MSHLSLPTNIKFVKLDYHGSSWVLPCKTLELLWSRCLVYSLPAFCSESNVAWMRMKFASPSTCLPTHKGPDAAWLVFPKAFNSHINPGLSKISPCQSGQGRGPTATTYPARSFPVVNWCRSTMARHFTTCMTSQGEAWVFQLMQCLYLTATSQCTSGQS